MTNHNPSVCARTVPIWLAVAALAAGMTGTFVVALFAGPWAMLLAPNVFVLSFKYVLGTSVLGSVLLAIVAAVGYAVMGHWLGGGGFPGPGTGIEV